MLGTLRHPTSSLNRYNVTNVYKLQYNQNHFRYESYHELYNKRQNENEDHLLFKRNKRHRTQLSRPNGTQRTRQLNELYKKCYRYRELYDKLDRKLRNEYTTLTTTNTIATTTTTFKTTYTTRLYNSNYMMVRYFRRVNHVYQNLTPNRTTIVFRRSDLVNTTRRTSDLYLYIRILNKRRLRPSRHPRYKTRYYELRNLTLRPRRDHTNQVNIRRTLNILIFLVSFRVSKRIFKRKLKLYTRRHLTVRVRTRRRVLHRHNLINANGNRPRNLQTSTSTRTTIANRRPTLNFRPANRFRSNFFYLGI